MLVYLALTSVIITGAIASAYPLFSNTGRSSLSVLRDLESAFVFQKVSYLMNQASAITTPGVGNTGDTLTLIINGDVHVVTLENGAVSLSVDGASSVPLTASRVEIDSLVFTHTGGAGGTPDTVTTDFNANGVGQGPFLRYVRF